MFQMEESSRFKDQVGRVCRVRNLMHPARILEDQVLKEPDSNRRATKVLETVRIDWNPFNTNPNAHRSNGIEQC